MSTQSAETGPWKLGETFANLTDDGSVTPVPVDADFWTSGVEQLAPGRLVSYFQNEADWTNWEMHPKGDEWIFLLSGVMVLILEEGTSIKKLRFSGGEFTIVPKGVWHTADIIEAGASLFITPGEGTRHKIRQA